MIKVNYQDYAAAYLAGKTPKELGAQAGIDGSTMYRNLRALGIPMRTLSTSQIGRKSATPGKPNLKKRIHDYERIKALYLSGKSLNQIAAEIGAADENVRYALKSMGIARIAKGAKPGDQNHQFIGGIRQRKDGYQHVRGSREPPLLHRVMVEDVLGISLPSDIVVHHVNCDPSDNRNENFVVCSHVYHMELHQRMKKHPYWSQFSNPLKNAS